MVSKGILLSTEGCLPSAKGARVRRSDGKITVTDGGLPAFRLTPQHERELLLYGLADVHTRKLGGEIARVE